MKNKPDVVVPSLQVYSSEQRLRDACTKWGISQIDDSGAKRLEQDDWMRFF